MTSRRVLAAVLVALVLTVFGSLTAVASDKKPSPEACAKACTTACATACAAKKCDDKACAEACATACATAHDGKECDGKACVEACAKICEAHAEAHAAKTCHDKTVDAKAAPTCADKCARPCGGAKEKGGAEKTSAQRAK